MRRTKSNYFNSRVGKDGSRGFCHHINRGQHSLSPVHLLRRDKNMAGLVRPVSHDEGSMMGDQEHIRRDAEGMQRYTGTIRTAIAKNEVLQDHDLLASRTTCSRFGVEPTSGRFGCQATTVSPTESGLDPSRADPSPSHQIRPRFHHVAARPLITRITCIYPWKVPPAPNTIYQGYGATPRDPC